jgi:hypothetical protein
VVGSLAVAGSAAAWPWTMVGLTRAGWRSRYGAWLGTRVARERGVRHGEHDMEGGHELARAQWDSAAGHGEARRAHEHVVQVTVSAMRPLAAAKSGWRRRRMRRCEATVEALQWQGCTHRRDRERARAIPAASHSPCEVRRVGLAGGDAATAEIDGGGSNGSGAS